jgi:hypothetical protein
MQDSSAIHSLSEPAKQSGPLHYTAHLAVENESGVLSSSHNVPGQGVEVGALGGLAVGDRDSGILHLEAFRLEFGVHLSIRRWLWSVLSLEKRTCIIQF